MSGIQIDGAPDTPLPLRLLHGSLRKLIMPICELWALLGAPAVLFLVAAAVPAAIAESMRSAGKFSNSNAAAAAAR